MRKFVLFPLAALSALSLSACAPNYSPNTYSSNAVQLANKVEQGTVIGYREVKISANGSIGAVTGGAVGGVLGAEYANSALVAVSGTTVGGMLGNALEHAARDTTGWEYIIRKENGDMLSVTQREATPLALAQRVLVIMGPQARVVPDYSVPQEPKIAVAPPVEEKKEAKVEPVKVEVVLSLPPGVTVLPKEEIKAAAVVEEEPVSAPREPTLADKLFEAVSVTTPLAAILAQDAPLAVQVPATTPEADSTPVAEAAAEPVAESQAPPSQR